MSKTLVIGKFRNIPVCCYCGVVKNKQRDFVTRNKPFLFLLKFVILFGETPNSVAPPTGFWRRLVQAK